MNFIGVLKLDSRIVEHSRQSNSLPDSNETVEYIEVTADQQASIITIQRSLSSEGREPIVYYTNELGVYSEDDNRTIFTVDIQTIHEEIEYSGTQEPVDYIIADDQDEATVTITMVDSEGITVPYSGSRVATFFSGRIVLLNYVNGIATKSFKSKESGLFTLSSTPDYKLTGEVNLLVVEL